jgi:hypothetical protein
MTKTTTRLFDSLCGSVYVEHQCADAREAWKLVARAARMGAGETWTFLATPQSNQTAVGWRPGLGLMVGLERAR